MVDGGGGVAPQLDIARTKLLSDIESSYLERDQTYASEMRDEYVRHFLHGTTPSSPPPPPCDHVLPVCGCPQAPSEHS